MKSISNSGLSTSQIFGQAFWLFPIEVAKGKRQMESLKVKKMLFRMHPLVINLFDSSHQKTWPSIKKSNFEQQEANFCPNINKTMNSTQLPLNWPVILVSGYLKCYVTSQYNTASQKRISSKEWANTTHTTPRLLKLVSGELESKHLLCLLANLFG